MKSNAPFFSNPNTDSAKNSSNDDEQHEQRCTLNDTVCGDEMNHEVCLQQQVMNMQISSQITTQPSLTSPLILHDTHEKNVDNCENSATDRHYEGNHCLEAGVDESTIATLVCDELDMSQTKVFQHQVGGHGIGQKLHGLLKLTEQTENGANSSCCILKPLLPGRKGNSEKSFYAQWMRIQEMMRRGEHLDDDVATLDRYIPHCHGLCSVRLSDNTTRQYLKLDDITQDHIRPCILDMKLGTRTYDPYASNEKIQRERIKCSYQAAHGFRFTGMKVWDECLQKYRVYNKYFGRSLTSSTLPNGFLHFFDTGTCNHATTIAPLLISNLQLLLHWFEQQRRWKFYASSLLIIYEGSSSAVDCKLRVHMIDFSHVHDIRDGQRDEGYVHGLNHIISTLQKVLQFQRQSKDDLHLIVPKQSVALADSPELKHKQRFGPRCFPPEFVTFIDMYQPPPPVP